MYYVKVMPNAFSTRFVNISHICSVEFHLASQNFRIYLSNGEMLVCTYNGFETSEMRECNSTACQALQKSIESGCLNS